MKFLTCNDGPNIQYEKQWPYWGEACTVDQSTEKWENIWETVYIFFHNINLSEGRKNGLPLSKLDNCLLCSPFLGRINISLNSLKFYKKYKKRNSFLCFISVISKNDWQMPLTSSLQNSRISCDHTKRKSTKDVYISFEQSFNKIFFLIFIQ